MLRIFEEEISEHLVIGKAVEAGPMNLTALHSLFVGSGRFFLKLDWRLERKTKCLRGN